MRTKLVLLAGTLLITLALAACGEKHGRPVRRPRTSAQPLSLMLDWFPNADHVGLYQALAEGDFTKAGLDVHVQVPIGPGSAAAAAGGRQGRRRHLLRA